jgi:hypothetical protein
MPGLGKHELEGQNKWPFSTYSMSSRENGFCQHYTVHKSKFPLHALWDYKFNFIPQLSSFFYHGGRPIKHGPVKDSPQTHLAHGEKGVLSKRTACTFCSEMLTHQGISSAPVLYSVGPFLAESLSYFWKNNFYFLRSMPGDTEMSLLVYSLSIISSALFSLILFLFLHS